MGKIITLVIISFIILMSFGLPHVTADTYNDNPKLENITITQETDLIFVKIAIIDLNKWNDIFNVSFEVFDNAGKVVSHVIYQQYESFMNSTETSVKWTETTGSYLKINQSTWNTIKIEPWDTDYPFGDSGLNVTFVFSTFSGQTIHLNVYDRGGANCEYIGPFFELNEDEIKITQNKYSLLLGIIIGLTILNIIFIILFIQKRRAS